MSPLRPISADQDGATLAHSRRVAALAIELGRMAGFPASMQSQLEQAALWHHALPMNRDPSPLGRLAWSVASAGESSDSGDPAPHDVASVIRLCNLLDEQFEALELEYRGTAAILDEIESFAAFEGFDPALVQHFREMRCGSLPRGDRIPVELSAARPVFRDLAQERDYAVRELADIAARDPVLAANLIRAANSCLYSPAGRFSGLTQAISYMGTDQTRKVMRAAVLRPLFASAKLGRLWTHSVATAQFCSALAGRTRCVAADECLTLGLLHDFGALAIQFAPRETLDRYARLVERGCPAAYVERLLFGRDHGEIGADILAQWHFSDDLIDAVRFHHQPERSRGTLAAFLYLVEFWSGLDEDLPSFHRVEDCLARTRISLEFLTEIGTDDGPLKSLRAL